MIIIKVAIMGAGLSGLSCAITLEKHGIEPTIFESRSQPGDRFVNSEMLIPCLSKPMEDPIAYFSDKHEIYLKPISAVSELVFISPNERAVLKGNLGFTNIRGRHENSFEVQLAKQVKSKIFYNSTYTHDDLVKEFTHVILATGDAAYASKLQNFDVDLSVTLKGATVEGNFKVYKPIVWLNDDFAPKGYAYLIPFSETEAHIVIGYPDIPENIKKNIEELWDKFYETVCSELNQNLRVTDRFEVTKYIMGICKYPRIGNTYFVGNNFGTLMPAFGFGQIPAIQTGICAADAVYGLGNYEELTHDIRRSYENSVILRKAMELMDNDNYDMIVKFLNRSTVNKLVNNPNRNPFRTASFLLRPLVKIRAKSSNNNKE